MASPATKDEWKVAYGQLYDNLVISVVVLGCGLFIILVIACLLYFLILRLTKKLQRHEEVIGSFRKTQKYNNSDPEQNDDSNKVTSRSSYQNGQQQTNGTLPAEHHIEETIDDENNDGETIEMAPVQLRNMKRNDSKTFSAFFGHRAVSIFGDVDMSHVYHLAQDYFEEDDEDGAGEQDQKPVEEVCIESIQVHPQHKAKMSKIENSFENPSFYLEDESTSPIKQKRPQSYYLTLDQPEQVEVEPNPGETMLNYRQGMFVKQTIGPSGGEVVLHGIKLTIPSGALDCSREISIGLFWGEDHYPVLQPGQSVLSPIVVCEPNGLKFNKPVKIVIPHCAVDIRNSWSVKLMMSDTVIQQSVRWRELTIADYDSRLINDTNITVEINHFTLYTVLGTSQENTVAAKCVRLVAFAPRLTARSLFKVRVYCVNHYEDEMRYLTTVEGDLGGTRVDSPTPLFVHDNHENVEINIENLMDGWKTLTPAFQEFDFENVWHATTPCCKFSFKATDESIDQVHCEFLAFQKSDTERKQRIVITEDLKTGNFLTNAGPASMFPFDLRRKLITELSVVRHTGKDWRAIASKLELDLSTVNHLETLQNPTELVLREWQNQKRTVHELYTYMREIGRLDVADDLKPYIREEDV